MRTILIAFLLLTVAISGCTSDDDTPEAEPTETSTETLTPTGTTTATGTGTSTTTSTSTTAPAPEANETEEPNTPPTASLAASIMQGEAPVEVTFTMNGTDADGDNLAWSFDADNDGTAELEGTDADFPATLVYEYTIEGVYNATLTVGDGINATVDFVEITITLAAPAGPTVYTGDTLATTTPLHTSAMFCTHAYTTVPLDCVLFEFEANHDGLPFTRASTGSNMWVDFVSDCADPMSSLGVFDADGNVPAGAQCAYAWAFGLGPATLTLTVG